GLQGSAAAPGAGFELFDNGLIKIADQNLGHDDLPSRSPSLLALYYHLDEPVSSDVSGMMGHRIVTLIATDATMWVEMAQKAGRRCNLLDSPYQRKGGKESVHVFA